MMQRAVGFLVGQAIVAVLLATFLLAFEITDRVTGSDAPGQIEGDEVHEVVVNDVRCFVYDSTHDDGAGIACIR